MKTLSQLVLAAVLCLSLAPAYSQFGPPGGAPPGPQFNKSMAKLFGENTAFSATLEIQSKGATADENITMPGRLAFDQGKSRFEMEMGKMKGGKAAEGMAQLKAMGVDMEKLVMISRPDKAVNYQVYPGMKAYTETALKEPDATAPDSDFKVEVTELGKETVDGHACVKNKTTVTDKAGNKHEAIVWNATDLKKFPLKIEQEERGATVTTLFKEVKLTTPEASLFEPPAGCTKYDDMGAMMREVMLKRMGGPEGMGGAVPRQP